MEIKKEGDSNNITPSVGIFGFDDVINISVGLPCIHLYFVYESVIPLFPSITFISRLQKTWIISVLSVFIIFCFVLFISGLCGLHLKISVTVPCVIPVYSNYCLHVIVNWCECADSSSAVKTESDVK